MSRAACSVEQPPLIFEQPLFDLGYVRHCIGKRQYPEPLGAVFDPFRTGNLRIGKLLYLVRSRERARGARHGVTQLSPSVHTVDTLFTSTCVDPRQAKFPGACRRPRACCSTSI